MFRFVTPIVPIAGLLATIVLGAPLHAQDRPDDRAWYQRLADGMAAAVYYVAWPTATYQRVAVHDVSLIDDGAVVTVRLHGASAFADGDLWVDVKVTMRRSGEVTDLRWGEYNGFFPPGFFWKTVGAAVQELNKRNGTSTSTRATAPPSASTPPVQSTVLCLSNTTARDLSYSMKWGAKSEALTLKAGERWRFWVPAAAATFEISFDRDLRPAVSAKTLGVTGVTVTDVPTSCTEAMTLDFIESQEQLGITTRVWVPTFPHPFVPHLVAAAEKERWTCAEGFKFAGPVSPESVECIEQTIGLTGLTLATQPKTPFLEVATVTPGWPAAEAGIASGTYIIAIEGISTEGLSNTEAISKIRGTVGTTVRLGIVVPGSPPRTVTLTRR